MTVPNPRESSIHLNLSYRHFSIAHIYLTFLICACIHTSAHTHAPQSRKDAITEDGIPRLPPGGGSARAKAAARLDDPNGTREKLKNKQIDKSSASLSRGGQVGSPHPKGTASRLRSRARPKCPRLAISRTYRNPPDTPGVWAPRPAGDPSAVCPARPARPGSTPPPSAQLSRLAPAKPPPQLKADCQKSVQPDPQGNSCRK